MKNKIPVIILALLVLFSVAFSKEKVKKEPKLKNKIAYTLRGNLFISKPDGSEVKQLTFEGGVSEPCWSPDGKTIIFVFNRKLWKYDIKTGKYEKFIDVPGYCLSPSFSTDGEKVIFTHESNKWDHFTSANYPEVCVVNADSSDFKVLLKPDNSWNSYPRFFPDELQNIVFNQLVSGNVNYYLATYNVSSGKIEYLNSESGWLDSNFSPDGNFLTAGWYSYEKGGELRIINLRTLGVKKVIPLTQGYQFCRPSFSMDGSRIVFEKAIYSHSRKTFVPYGIYIVNTDGSGLTRLVLDGADPDWLWNE
ncbi:MAG TPA: hypothetical protein PL110_04130 [Candidatus Eremiobacteraeota bacterium]|nr:hypothetical protein [Candidatus Eremiobacteraeota bacterium]